MTIGRRAWTALALLVLQLPAASADLLYKCRGPDGVSYRSHSCLPGETEVWTRAYRPEPPAPVPPPRAEPRPRERALSPKHARWYPRREPVDACTAAKAHRDWVLARVGLKRTFDLLRQLDDAVYDACK